LEHADISQASVVGLKDQKYDEVVAAFLQLRDGHTKVSQDKMRDWVWQKLGRHKAPTYIFWVGPRGVISQFPSTGSGKIRKDMLRAIGNKIIEGKSNSKMNKMSKL
jgi:acyl-coenzyme A synthetase/AMP-(fatty) acid ligase